MLLSVVFSLMILFMSVGIPVAKCSCTGSVRMLNAIEMMEVEYDMAEPDGGDSTNEGICDIDNDADCLEYSVLSVLDVRSSFTFLHLDQILSCCHALPVRQGWTSLAPRYVRSNTAARHHLLRGGPTKGYLYMICTLLI